MPRYKQHKALIDKEVQAMSRTNTLNGFIKFYGTLFECEPYYIVMELGSFTLRHLLTDPRRYISVVPSHLLLPSPSYEPILLLVLCLLQDMFAALAVLHTHNYVHRDIKPENVLVMAGTLTCKIGDMGMMRLSDVGMSMSMAGSGGVSGGGGEMKGSPIYMTPHQFRLFVAGVVIEYSLNVDLYAAGITMFEMCARAAPYPGLDMRSLIAAKVIGTRPTLICSSVYTNAVESAASDCNGSEQEGCCCCIEELGALYDTLTSPDDGERGSAIEAERRLTTIIESLGGDPRCCKQVERILLYFIL